MRNTNKQTCSVDVQKQDGSTTRNSHHVDQGRQPRSTQRKAKKKWKNLPLAAKSGGKIYRLTAAMELQYEPTRKSCNAVSFRDAVCALCEKTVALALNIPLASLQARTRSSAEVALARQIAMYLCHTTFSLLLTEIGFHFKRDRTTVSYACALVEDKRDDLSFDLLLCQLEALLVDARRVMIVCENRSTQQQENPSDLPHSNPTAMRDDRPVESAGRLV